MALIGFAHLLFAENLLFGVYRYAVASPPFITPFANPNHLASFLSVGAFVALGLAARAHERTGIFLFGLAYLVQATGVFLSLSRGGALAFLAGHLVFVGLLWSTREGRALSPNRFLSPGIAAVALAVIGYVAWERISARMSTLDEVAKIKETKVALIPSFVPMVRDFWLSGVGRGAFEDAYTRYQPGIVDARFTHPENWVFQNLCEMGVLGGLLCLGGVWAWGRSAARRPRSGVAVGALSAVFAVVLHDFGDFGLEFGGVAVPVGLALALATWEDSGPALLARPWFRSWEWGLAVVTGLALVPAAIGSSRHNLGSDGRLAAETIRSPPQAEAVVARLASMHPADYYLQMVPAVAWASEKPFRAEKVLPWANRAMFLNPSASGPHRLTARALLALGRPRQARVEYRLAYPGLDRSRDLIEEICARFHRPTELIESVPDTPEAVGALWGALSQHGQFELALETSRAFIEHHGEDSSSLVDAAAAARHLGRLDDAVRFAQRAVELDPESVSATVECAEAFAAQGNYGRAIDVLRTASSRDPLEPRLLAFERDYLDSAGKYDEARATNRRLLVMASTDVERASLFAVEGASYAKEGNTPHALDSYRAAIRTDPESLDWRWKLVRLLETSGRLIEARMELDRMIGIASPEQRPEVEAVRLRVTERLEQVVRAP